MNKLYPHSPRFRHFLYSVLIILTLLGVIYCFFWLFNWDFHFVWLKVKWTIFSKALHFLFSRLGCCASFGMGLYIVVTFFIHIEEYIYIFMMEGPGSSGASNPVRGESDMGESSNMGGAASTSEVNLDLTLAPPRVDDQVAPPVVEGPQQPPVVADVFPERGELDDIIDRLTSSQIDEVLGRYPGDDFLHYPGDSIDPSPRGILTQLSWDFFSAGQRAALLERANAHLTRKREILTLMGTLDPSNPWDNNSTELRRRVLCSLWDSEFHVTELDGIINNLRERGTKSYWFRELKGRIESR